MLSMEGRSCVLQVPHGLVYGWPILTFLPEARQTLSGMELFFNK